MIKEAYCSKEVSKLLKEKGFLKGVNLRLIPNLAFYDNIGLQYDIAKWYDSLIQDKIDFVVAPTHQMAMAWLREVHNKHCDIGYDIDLYWFFQIIELKELIEHFDYPEIKYYHAENETGFNTYEEAVEAAIKYCLENLL